MAARLGKKDLWCLEQAARPEGIAAFTMVPEVAERHSRLVRAGYLKHLSGDHPTNARYGATEAGRARLTYENLRAKA